MQGINIFDLSINIEIVVFVLLLVNYVFNSIPQMELIFSHVHCEDQTQNNLRSNDMSEIITSSRLYFPMIIVAL